LKSIGWYLAAVLALLPGVPNAGGGSYVCEIDGFQLPPAQDAELLEWVGELAMETTVAIDRETGRVIHPVIGNTSFNDITVLNRGSGSWSFKALADSGDGGHVRYYEVSEYVESAEKPFVVVADGIAFWGTCH
jgi:hypothetical protein